MRVLDRGAAVLLLLGAAGHTAGTLHWLSPSSNVFIWSLGSSLAALLLGALNLVRAGRPGDQTLAWICLLGTLGWAMVVLGFGLIIGNVVDPRVDLHLTASLALAAFSIRTLLRPESALSPPPRGERASPGR
jgi:hypothetical protein